MSNWIKVVDDARVVQLQAQLAEKDAEIAALRSRLEETTMQGIEQANRICDLEAQLRTARVEALKALQQKGYILVSLNQYATIRANFAQKVSKEKNMAFDFNQAFSYFKEEGQHESDAIAAKIEQEAK